MELVALLPMLLLAGTAVWQGVVAARTATIAAAGARSAARAVAVGADPRSALLRSIPSSEATRAKLTRRTDGSVLVELAVPRILIGGTLGRLHAGARFVQGAGAY